MLNRHLCCARNHLLPLQCIIEALCRLVVVSEFAVRIIIPYIVDIEIFHNACMKINEQLMVNNQAIYTVMHCVKEKNK